MLATEAFVAQQQRIRELETELADMRRRLRDVHTDMFYCVGQLVLYVETGLDTDASFVEDMQALCAGWDPQVHQPEPEPPTAEDEED